MKEIPLTQGKVALVDDEDFAGLALHRWGASCIYGIFYATRLSGKRGQRKTIYMHREIMRASRGQNIDHRDNDGLNNQRFNLRFATDSQNNANRGIRLDNKSGFIGVCWHRQHKRWQATIRKDRRQIHLGYFADSIDAAKAYDRAVVAAQGEFARPNFLVDTERAS